MKHKFIDTLKDYSILSLGVLLYTFAWGCFVIPNGMSAGGLTGLCTILQFATHGLIPVYASYAALNVIFLVAAFIILGTGFGFKTIYCIILSTIMFEVWALFPGLHSLEGNFLYVPERFLIPIIGGLVEAFGLQLIFSRGGSSGGTDIIALVVNKYFPISPGKLFMYLDFVIIGSILLLPEKGFSDMIYGYLMMITFSISLDLMLMGRQSSVKLLVFSQNYKLIADRIMKEMDRGVTVIQATGWFTKTQKNVLLVIIRQRQLRQLERIVKSEDPKAFITVSRTSTVYGEGFEQIKTGIGKNKQSDEHSKEQDIHSH